MLGKKYFCINDLKIKKDEKSVYTCHQDLACSGKAKIKLYLDWKFVSIKKKKEKL